VDFLAWAAITVTHLIRRCHCASPSTHVSQMPKIVKVIAKMCNKIFFESISTKQQNKLIIWLCGETNPGSNLRFDVSVAYL
jgi:hypothetical protein